MKQIEHFFKNIYLNSRIWWHYGTLHPESIPLVQSEQHIYVDSRDPRARKKIVADAMRERFPRNQRFWRKALVTLDPTTVLDIGLNYGECLFAPLYGTHCRVYGFDANPKLKAYAERSQADHPSRERIDLRFQLVTDGDQGEEEFFIDKKWSGGSAAGLNADDYDKTRYEKVTMPKASIDHVLGEAETVYDRLMFKIDVEGYEYRVLCGMEQSLEKADQFVGFIEFDARLLERAGEDVEDYWAYLKTHFHVCAFTRSDQWCVANDLDLTQLAKLCGKHFHTDLVLTKPGEIELAEQVLMAWQPFPLSTESQTSLLKAA